MGGDFSGRTGAVVDHRDRSEASSIGVLVGLET